MTKNIDKDLLTSYIKKIFEEAKVDQEFPKNVLSEAEKFKGEVKKSDHKNRTDLTHLPFCTIDGETAKDFDDAVFAQAKGDYIEVWVAIADVGHYVTKDSFLDQEAFLRSTSIYYPGHVVPMLPESLSNHLCSLKPEVYRLSMSVKFLVGKGGGILQPKAEESIIKSRARLTYTDVESILIKGQKDKKVPKNVLESLTHLKTASERLRKARSRRGSIDFDITESLVTLDKEGEILSINPEERLFSHMMIEDLMVAANEIIAQHFSKKDIPCIYRVHEPPTDEKMGKVTEAIKSFGISIKKPIKNADFKNPKNVQNLMKAFSESKYKETLTSLSLRAMMQAKYSEHNLGHFGLASKAYLHFTSPIRRYADLIVHRELKAMLHKKKANLLLTKEEAGKIANFISQKEAQSVDIERKIHRLYATYFMSQMIGETFLGTISACTEFGFFVKLKDHHIEGLVHIATISKSFVQYMPESMCLVLEGGKKRFLVGDEVKVTLKSVNLSRGFIDLILANKYDNKFKTDKRRNNRIQ